jgi:hypothetical protein
VKLLPPSSPARAGIILGLTLSLALLCASSHPLSAAPVIPEDLMEDEFFREELGVNDFTVPSIRKVFSDLDKLEPIPYERLTRPIPEPPASDRLTLALNFGALLADGFLAVQNKDQQQIEAISRALVKYCVSMGVGEKVKPHGKSLLEKAFSQDWNGLKDELASTQHDVEYEMMSLRDEQIAHLISLGGWLRAMQIGSDAVDQSYSMDRAKALVRVELLDYYLDRLSTLHPRLMAKPEVIRITADLKDIRAVLETAKDGVPDPEGVKRIVKASTDANNAITGS